MPTAPFVVLYLAQKLPTVWENEEEDHDDKVFDVTRLFDAIK
jgi:hypothetical protein